VLINTSPEPFSNWAASITEDVTVIAGVWACLQHPFWFLVALAVFIALMIWLLPKIWDGIKKVFQFIFRLFGGETAPNPPV
jgi:CBS domain containing-hemolysin-like protein